MISVRRLTATLRAVSGDRGVTLRLGSRARYVPRLHLVELQEEVQSWSRDRALALVAHEGAHVRITRYFSQFSPAVRRDREKMMVANVLEDARINRWAVHHWPGLADGFAQLDDLAYGVAEDAPGEELRRSGESLLPEVEYVWALRAAADGRVRPPPVPEEVRAAVQRSLLPVRAVLDRWPRDEPATASEIDACSAALVACLEEVVFPEFDALRAQSRAALEERLDRRVAAEVIRKSYEPCEDGSIWRGWAQAATGRAAVLEFPTRSTELAPLGDRVAPFAAQLRDALRCNEEPWQEAGFPSGRRVDLRQAFLMAGDPSRYDRVWRRPTERTERVWRLLIAADVSDSMAGAPMESLSGIVRLCLEAAERVGFATSLILFGVRGPEPTRVLKDFREPLARRRGEIHEALANPCTLGTETPLAAALDEARLQVEGEPEGETLAIVITDGVPRATSSRLYLEPTRMGTSDDSGRAGKDTEVMGRVAVWEPAAVTRERVRVAGERFEAVPGAHLVGVGVGRAAEIGNCFRESVRYADFDAFARDFPEYLAGEFARRLGPAA